MKNHHLSIDLSNMDPSIVGLAPFDRLQNQYLEQDLTINSWDAYRNSSMSTTSDNLSTIHSSPNSTNGDMASPSQFKTEDEAAAESRPKRKRENRYKNAPQSVLSRRRAQNRASQRAYRERKEQRIRDLEQLLEEASQRYNNLGQAYAALHLECSKLHAARQQQACGPVPGLMGLDMNNDGLSFAVPEAHPHTTMAGATTTTTLYPAHMMGGYPPSPPSIPYTVGL